MARTYLATIASVLLLGCARAHDVDALDGLPPEDRPSSAAGRGSVADSCAEQIESSLDGLPDDLTCTGLYADFDEKDVAEDVHEYTPGLALWSDGSGKQRWIHLPEGEVIDASDMANWSFPVGTKFFKEFSVDGRRIETRLYQKVRSDRWVRATYEWNARETAATRSKGGDLSGVQINGATYHIPDVRECDECHEGRRDRILGFEAIGLGVEGARGLTLAELVDRELISPAPERVSFEIGDDGTGLAAPVLGWIHMNCGVSCHNDNQN